MDSVESVYAATAQYMSKDVVHPLVQYYTSAQYETGIWGSYSVAEQTGDPTLRDLYNTWDKTMG